MAKHHDTPGEPVPKTKAPACQVRQIKVNHTHANNRRVPWIRIQGEWLHRAGFTIDTPVQIHVMEGCLVFKVET
jgi:hypothetical protein